MPSCHPQAAAEMLCDQLRTITPPAINLSLCAAHTLSLSGDKNLEELLRLRVFTKKLLIKQLRRPSLQPYLKQHKKGKPPIKVCTRWLSQYTMCRYVYKERVLVMQYLAEYDVQLMRSDD